MASGEPAAVAASAGEDLDGEAVFDPSDVPPPSVPQQHTYTAEDGTVYYWDGAHNMWLPQVCYSLNYNFLTLLIYTLFINLRFIYSGK